MRIIVTGAAGFIGSHLVDRLVQRGDAVWGVDNFDPFYDARIKRDNLSDVIDADAFELHEFDIRDAAKLEDLVGAVRPDAIVHLAARAGVRPSIENPALYADVNVVGTTNVFEAARKFDIGRVVYASSSSVYGGNTKVPFVETDPVENPISPYAATKRATELLAATYHQLYGVTLIGLRFFTVYGPRQRPEMAIHKFTRLIDEGLTVPMFGDGTSRRDYTYIDDCIDGVISAIDRASGCELYNLGESQTTTIRELIALIGDALELEPVIEQHPEQPGDVAITYADVSKARRDLDYRPKTLVADGVPRFVRWYREHAHALSEGAR